MQSNALAWMSSHACDSQVEWATGDLGDKGVRLDPASHQE
jgi:hypothetical protein